MSEPASIREHLIRVRERISRAAESGGRSSSDITLVAVSKTVEVAQIEEAMAAGITDFGENYLQEARPKVAKLPDLRWHFIGHLQKNKDGEVGRAFHLIQSVDSVEIARALGKRAEPGMPTKILLEVKIDPAATKFGIEPERCMDVAAECREMGGVSLYGLMGMAPVVERPEEAKPYFRRLYELFQKLPTENRLILSMGMTADFEAAIQEGATMVRIGTAIFGPRT